MTVRSLFAGAAALGALATALVPALASAQPYGAPPPPPGGYYDSNGAYHDPCRSETNQRKASGAVIGGILGAVVGSNVAARGHRSDGALVGAGVGALAGAKVGKDSADCRNDRRYYDDRQGYNDNGGYQPAYDNGYRQPYDDRYQDDRYRDDRYQTGGGYYAQGGSYYDPCRRDTRQRGVAGALIGGAIGAAVGSNVAASGHRSDGALVGAGVGALAGAKVGSDTAACRDGYQQGYYDNGGYQGGYAQGGYTQSGYDGAYAYDRYGQSYEVSGPVGDDGCTFAESPVYLPDGTVQQRQVRVCLDADGRYQVVD